MNLSNIIHLLTAMILLAMTPDASVIAVVGRSLGSGFRSGLITIIGLLCGDLIFILMAIYGLSHLAQNMEFLFTLIKYLGSIYLIYLGVILFISKVKAIEIEAIKDNNDSWQSNFTCGLLITLSDPKAIVFYISFLPAFVDLSTISLMDIIIIFLCATIAVGGVKLVYAYLANQTVKLLRSSSAQQASQGSKTPQLKLHQITNYLASMMMIATGIVLFFSS